ncbi:MAG: Fic family protein [Desulfoprunum sp.]|nr:Fic family protein [Desulfoprunum sp.]
MDNYPHLLFKRHWQITPDTNYHLGECEAMIRAISNTPLRPQERDRLLTVSLIKGAQATAAIEGNTLSQEEVERIYLKGENLPPSKEYLQTEVENVINALNYLLQEVVRHGNEWPITPELLLDFHKRISQNLGDHIDAIPGRWRQDRRQVGPYLAPEHRFVPELMGKLCDWLREEFHYHIEQDFKTAVIQAIVTHVYIEWIHPFGDGNGRTGRLVEFFILLRSGLPSIASHIPSNFYNETRNEYYRQLNNARTQKDLSDFISYAVQGFRDGLEENLKIIQEGQMKIFWRNHVFESFADVKHTKTTVFKRKRALMFSIPINTLLTPSEILVKDPDVMREYSQFAKSTFETDLKDLVRMGLLIKADDKYLANTSKLLASLPERREPL